MSCHNDNENDGNYNYNETYIKLNKNNLKNLGNISCAIYDLVGNKVYINNFLFFIDEFNYYSDLYVTLNVTYSFNYILTDGTYGTSTRSSVVNFNDDQYSNSSVYISLLGTIWDIEFRSIRFNVVKASGYLYY